MTIQSAINRLRIDNVETLEKTTRRVATDFKRMLATSYRLRVDGQAKRAPGRLLESGYTPKYEIELFGTRYFLCNQRDSEGLKVMPAYVLPAGDNKTIYARVFYKDSSLVWRSASHFVNTDDEYWIGKGALRLIDKRGVKGWFSVEETTNLPLEISSGT